MTVQQLYEQAKAICPDVRFVTVESHFGDLDLIPQVQYYAHTHSKAFTGETPDEVLADILSNAFGKVARA